MFSPLRCVFQRAFTLIELLVSITVLILLVVMVSQMVSSTTKLTTNSQKYIDADRQARLVFDRLADDFGGMIQRPDVDSLFIKNGAGDGSTGFNDAMYFFSSAPGYYKDATNKAPVSLVGYRINTKYQLERLSKGLTWDDGSGTGDAMTFLALPPANSVSLPANTTIAGRWPAAVGSPPGSNSGTDTDFHLLAESVFRMEICFVVRNLTDYTSPPSFSYSNTPVAYFDPSPPSPLPTPINKSTLSSSPPSSPKVRDRWFDTANNRAWRCTYDGTVSTGTSAVQWVPQGLADVQGVIITLAILDTKSARPIQLHGVLPPLMGDPLVNYLVDPAERDLIVPPMMNTSNPTPAPSPARPILPSQTWTDKLPALASTLQVPQAVAGQVRVYQRLYSLNNP